MGAIQQQSEAQHREEVYKLLDSYKAERIRNEHTVVKGIKKNSKMFFKYAKKFRKFRQSIVNLKNNEGVNIHV